MVVINTVEKTITTIARPIIPPISPSIKKSPQN
jgi:hypothetical protein